MNYHLPVLNIAATYTNPPSYENLSVCPTNPDPYVIKFDGVYYCYSTGEHGVNVSRSLDLVTWHYLGQVAKEENKHDYWAPCVIYDNGVFYLYCSNTNIHTKDNHQEYLQLYTSTHPEGPFTYQKTFFQKFSIDSHVVKDLDGTVYLFYSVNDYTGTDSAFSGTCIMVDRLINYTELAGEERPVVLPSIQEEIFAENRFGDGRDWHTVEGAFFLRKNNHTFLLYAANAYVRENYYLGYSRGKNNARIADLIWEKYPDDYTYCPLVKRNFHIEGTGHCSVIQAPNLIDHWLIYHGRDQQVPLDPESEQRMMYIDPLFFSGDRIITNAPSYLPQDVPAQPDYCCYASLPEEDFTSHITGGILRKTLNHSPENYVMEWDISSIPTHMGAQYGIILSQTSNDNLLELIFDSGKRRVSLFHEEHHLRRVISERMLPHDYDHRVSHNLRILRNYDRFTVLLDCIPIFQTCHHIPFGKVGFTSRYTQASVHFFAITEHAELSGETLSCFSKNFSFEQPVLLSSSGIPCCGKPIRLNECVPSNSHTKNISVRLLTPNAILKLHIKDEDQIVFTVLLENQTLKYVEYVDETEVLLYETSYKEKAFTLYIKNHAAKTFVYLDNHTCSLHQSFQQIPLLQLEVYQVEIIGFQVYS